MLLDCDTQRDKVRWALERLTGLDILMAEQASVFCMLKVRLTWICYVSGQMFLTTGLMNSLKNHSGTAIKVESDMKLKIT